MAIHYSLEWEEHPDMEVTMKSYTRVFKRKAMPSMEATGKTCRMKWTGPSATMLERMDAIHSGGEMRTLAPAVAAAGRIQVLGGGDICAGLQAVRIGGVNVVRPAAGTWEAMVAAINAQSGVTGVSATGSAQSCAGVLLEANEVGPAGDGITLDLGLNPYHALLSGPHLEGGAEGAARRARVVFTLGDAAAAGELSLYGRTLSVAAAAGAPAASAIGAVRVSEDRAEALVSIAGIDVRGGGDGLVARINALGVGVHASWADGHTLLIECDDAGSFGNELPLEAFWDDESGEVPGYCVALGRNLSGGADAGVVAAVAATAAVGIEGAASDGWDGAGVLRLKGLRVECRDGERLWEAVNRMNEEGAFGSRGVVAEPIGAEPLMTLHAVEPGAWGNEIGLEWTAGAADAGREFVRAFNGGADEVLLPARGESELVEELSEWLSEDGAFVGVRDASASGFIASSYSVPGITIPAAPAVQAEWDFSDALGAVVTVNGVALPVSDKREAEAWNSAFEQGGIPLECTAAYESADGGFFARIRAVEAGAAGNANVIVVNGLEVRPVVAGADGRDLAGLAAYIEQHLRGSWSIVAEGAGLRFMSDARAWVMTGPAVLWEEGGERYPVVPPVARVAEVRGGEVTLEALAAGTGGNDLELVVFGCFSVDGTRREYAFSGGAGSADARASGWLRLPLATGGEMGLRVAGRRVQLASEPGTASAWAAAINALDVGVTARAVTFSDYAVVLSAVTAGEAGNAVRVGVVGDASGLDVWGMSGGADEATAIDYSASELLPEGMELAPWPVSDKSGYCWEITSTVKRVEGEVAELETTWNEVFFSQDEEDAEAEDEEEGDGKREEEEEDEQVGEDENNPEVDIETTAVLEPILSHPKAKNYSEVQLEACHLYMSGRSMNAKFVMNGKTYRIGDVFPKDVIGRKIRAGITEYYVPHTVARKTWKAAQGKVHNACEIGRTGGLPAAGADRNWMCMGGGKNKRGTETTCTETWELSSPGGWDRDLYSGN